MCAYRYLLVYTVGCACTATATAAIVHSVCVMQQTKEMRTIFSGLTRIDVPSSTYRYI